MLRTVGNKVVPSALSLKTTRVLRCVVSLSPRQPSTYCSPATDRLFYASNGIAATPDGSTVFVADPLGPRLVMLSRREGKGEGEGKGKGEGEGEGEGKGRDQPLLEPLAILHPMHTIDNVEYRARDGKLVAGSVPIPYASHTACAAKIGATEEHSYEDGTAFGRFL